MSDRCEHSMDRVDCYACAKAAHDAPLLDAEATVARLRTALERIGRTYFWQDNPRAPRYEVCAAGAHSLAACKEPCVGRIAREALGPTTGGSPAILPRDHYIREALEEAGTEVPRGHCNRCDRCGWEYDRQGRACRPGDCSMRPLPPLRLTCAGCGRPLNPAPARCCPGRNDHDAACPNRRPTPETPR